MFFWRSSVIPFDVFKRGIFRTVLIEKVSEMETESGTHLAASCRPYEYIRSLIKINRFSIDRSETKNVYDDIVII